MVRQSAPFLVVASAGVLAWAGLSDLGAGLALVTETSPVHARRGGYVDDTFARPAGVLVKKLDGEQPPEPLYFRPRDGRRHYIEARGALFTISNSRNDSPSAARPCAVGPLPINRYPITIWSTEAATLAGGTFRGAVPQETDWQPTYCDSAAVILRDSPNATVDGVRISTAWDGVRVWTNSRSFVVENSWLSKVRDDAVEDDTLVGGRISDTLIDGTFMGLSLRPVRSAAATVGPGGRVDISGSLFRMAEYPYEGQWRLGALLKVDQHSPGVAIRNSVIAVDGPRGSAPVGRYWALGWDKVVASSNNLFLWLSDAPLPKKLALPRSGFRVLQGAPARAAWASARKNWIDCHPGVGRLPGDPASNPGQCRPGVWGGFTN
jgi:hypothetical protein